MPDFTDPLKNNDVDIPSSVEAMGVKSANQFYRAKMKSLQVENVRLQMELKKKVGIVSCWSYITSIDFVISSISIYSGSVYKG